MLNTSHTYSNIHHKMQLMLGPLAAIQLALLNTKEVLTRPAIIKIKTRWVKVAILKEFEKV